MGWLWLEIGNLDARRDWGYAPDYVRAMHLMLTQDAPEDFVVATGVLHTARDFCRIAFAHAGLDWEEHVVSAQRFFRPEEAIPLHGDPTRIQSALGWKPTRTFEEIVREMVDQDLAAIS